MGGGTVPARDNLVDPRRGRWDSVTVRVGVLGPLLVGDGAFGLGPRDRVVLSVLAARAGAVVRTDTLAEALWGEDPPASALKVLQGCVLRIRRGIGAEGVRTDAGGYRLALRRDELDATAFEDLVGRARALLESGQPDRARYCRGPSPRAVAGRAVRGPRGLGAGDRSAGTPRRATPRRRGAGRRGRPGRRRPRGRARRPAAARRRAAEPRAPVAAARPRGVPQRPTGGRPRDAPHRTPPPRRGARARPRPRARGARGAHAAARTPGWTRRPW